MSIPGEDSNLFSRLHREDAHLRQDKHQKALAEIAEAKQRLLWEQSRTYTEELLRGSSSRRVNVPQVSIPNSELFRALFLQQRVRPLTDEHHTVASLMTAIDQVGREFGQLGVVDQLYFELHQAPSGPHERSSASVFPVIHLQPVKKFFAKTGTSIGNGEGDSYISVQYKNMFGGAENLVVDASTGTRTRASYLINFNTPLMNRADLKFETLIHVNSQNLETAGYDTRFRGTTQKVYYTQSTLQHEVSFENYWRTVQNVSSLADTVLSQLGDDIRSSVVYACKYDTRNDVHLPTSGTYWRWGAEYSGLFALNKHRFFKTASEVQTGFRLGPFFSATLTGKAGLLYPLGGTTTSILDRFYLGGANDVRGFTILGLGPKQARTPVGGDVFLSGGLSLFSHIPKTAMDSHFRFHHFVNWGKAVPLDTHQGLQSAVEALASPSVSVGMGLVFNHPMARFEANFGLPIQIAAGDSVRKGFQFGLGMSFM